MHNLPFRTGTTWLSDDHLLLLDVLFDKGASFRLLRREIFREQWNLRYTHNLDDAGLECNLHWLCEHGVLELERDEGYTCFQMTRNGGELWSQERCPVWDRYCNDRRYSTTSRGRAKMTVVASSARVRDDFLTFWPPEPARRRTAITTGRLLPWLPFGRVYAGVATYEKPPRRWTPAEYVVWAEQDRRHRTILERERSWWQCVSELQRFVP